MRPDIPSVILALTLGIACAQLAIEPGPEGNITSITLDGQGVGQQVQMRIVKPGWNGAYAVLGDNSGVREVETPAEGVRLFEGQLDCEGKPCAFRERIEPAGDGWRIGCELTPSTDLETELVVITIDLPTKGNAGQGSLYLKRNSAILRHELPATLPDPYHIASASPLKWCAWLLPGDVGLLIEPDGEGINGVSFQDNRQFNISAFQAQFPVRETKGLKAGKTYRFGVTLRPFDAARLAGEEQTIVDMNATVAVELRSEKPLALRGMTISPERPKDLNLVEIDLDLDATFDNPFDPEDIDVTAVFTGDEGRTVRVPGFYYQGYEWVDAGGAGELLRKVGEPSWKVRFAPPAADRYTVRVTVRDRTGTVTSEPVVFECGASADPGFVRRAPEAPYYLEFDSGEPYFAVGENVCWTGVDNTRMYDTWFSSLGNAGGNYARIWLVRWNMGLEWTNQGHRQGYYYGLGKYSLDNAWRLDWVMDSARRNGIYCMLALGYHGELQEQADYFNTQCWQWNPYNVANGGPCEKPADFWTSEQARKFYQQRLRYYVARWGWDAHILSWEFWNEVRAPAPWVDEMAKWFEANDPYGHLVTTTYGYDEVWRIPELDYTQAHTYGSDDTRHSTTPHIASLGREYTTNWQKPFMVGEFGIDWKRSDSDHDPKGLGTSLHNGMWASIMTRSFGTAAIWYWDGYVHPKNLYHEFASIKAFVNRVPWNKCRFEFLDADPVRVPSSAEKPWSDITVQPLLGWGPSNHTDYAIRPDGTVENNADFAATLFSDSKKNIKRPLRFHVTYPSRGKLIFRVASVSSNAVLHIRVDGEEVYQKEFTTGPGEGEWQETKFYEQWGIWQSRYDKDYEVIIPAGEHVIEFENTGADWISIGRYTFTGCKDPAFADVDLLGLRTDNRIIGWFHDRESTWYNDREGKVPEEISGAHSILRGLTDGTYSIDWWDTRTGKVILNQVGECVDGNMPIVAPAFIRDVAFHAVKAEG